MDGVFVDVVFAVQLRVDRDEVIVGGDLQAMAAVVEQRNVGGRGGLGEFGDRALHARLIEIDAERDLEAEGLQFRGDVPGVVGRIGERRHVAIGAVADHQGDARLGARAHAAGGQPDQRRGRTAAKKSVCAASAPERDPKSNRNKGLTLRERRGQGTRAPPTPG